MMFFKQHFCDECGVAFKGRPVKYGKTLCAAHAKLKLDAEASEFAFLTWAKENRERLEKMRKDEEEKSRRELFALYAARLNAAMNSAGQQNMAAQSSYGGSYGGLSQ